AVDTAVDTRGRAGHRATTRSRRGDREGEFGRRFEVEGCGDFDVFVKRHFAGPTARAVAFPSGEFGAEIGYGDKGDFRPFRVARFAFFGRAAFDFAFDFAGARAF